MSHLKYSFPLGNDHSRLRSLFCSSALVLPRPCWVGVGTAWGGHAHLTSQQWGFGENREAGRQLCVLAHPGSWAAPGAGCKLVQSRAAMRYILSFANGHNVWSQIGGKQPKKRKACHFLHPNKGCWELHQHAQGFGTGNSDPDFPSQDKHNTLSALFSDLMLGKPSAASAQGRVCCSTVQALSPFSLCLPVAVCEPQGAAYSLMRAAVPWHSPFCCHAGNSVVPQS